MATQVVELTGDEAKLLKSLDAVIKKQLEYERKLHDTGEAGASAGLQVGDALRKVEEEANRTMKGLLRELNQVGPEGQAASAALKDHLQSAGKAGMKSFDDMIAQLRLIDPEAAEAAKSAADAIKRELSEAAQFSELEFQGPLDELRKLGPEGRTVAEQLKRNLIEAGKLGEKSMEDVIAKLEQIDPEAAAAARSIAASLVDAGEEGETAFAKFGKSAVGQLSSIAAGYLGMQAAISAVNGFLQEQLDLMNEAREAQIELASSQQDTIKNLAGLAVIDRNELLKSAAPDIAAKSGFSDIGKITQAIGTVASVGESSPERIANAVLQAARIETLNPENLSTTAASAVDVQRKSGLEDVRQGIALFQTTLSQARIETADALATALPQAVGSAVATVPAQDRLTAAREAAALYAQITQGGTDTQGRSSATFITDLTVRMSKFFTEIEDERVKARSAIELIDRKIAKGSDTELDRQKRSEAQAFLDASNNLTDSGTLFGRLQQLQSSDALSKQFMGEGFGEKQFAIVLKELMTANSERVQAVRDSFSVIQADTAFFENQVKTLNESTPQLVLGNSQSRLDAAIEANKIVDTEKALLAQIRKIVSETKENTRDWRWATIAPTLIESIADQGITWGSMKGGTAAEEAVSGIIQLEQANASDRRDGLTFDERRRVKLRESQIENLLTLLSKNVESGSLDPDGITYALRRMKSGYLGSDVRSPITSAEGKNMLPFDRIVEALTTIAENTKATMENTAKESPLVTPALSSQTP